MRIQMKRRKMTNHGYNIYFVLTLLQILLLGSWTSEASAYENSGNDAHDILSCCAQVYGSCRTSCENLSLVQLATIESSNSNSKDHKLHDVRKYCPLMQIEFWKCMNKTLQAIAKGAQWSGRPCCGLALSPRCQSTCAVASARGDLASHCRQSDEQNFYTCLTRQEAGEECCSNSRTSECLHACKVIFQSRLTPTREQRENVLNACEDNDFKVLNCVRNYTDVSIKSNLKQYLPCCDFGINNECREKCRTILSDQQITQQETIDALEQGGCGPPLPHDQLWQCFLSAGKKIIQPANSNDVSRINQIGMDSAKLHCCQKAFAPKCRKLCENTFSNDWTDARSEFDLDCLTQISEVQLRQCIDEVDEPCELGCGGLSFCSNFNNRPTELFRSCTVHADNAAKVDVQMWQDQGYLSLPGLDLPIRKISACSFETWRAIACTLQIKPCTRNTHSNHICREDCYDILSRCMDWTRMSSGLTVVSLCSRLSSDDDSAPCVSIKPYMEPSDVPYSTELSSELSSPCRGMPCNSTEICSIVRNGITNYSCSVGCSLGEASAYMVPAGTYVRIPVSAKQNGCLKICKCGATGRIETCQPLPCITYESCNIGGRRVDHNSWFYVECNICSCFAGEITCTKKQCHIPGVSDRSYTSLPCNCPLHYVPVCARNGNTYPSACIAKCTGLHDSDFEFGSCRTRKACDRHNCSADTVCVEDRNVCLSNMHKPCPQYECVNLTSSCEFKSSVTDTNMRVYPSICELLLNKATLAFRGSYKNSCRSDTKGFVCGINGVTYRSECEAWSDYSSVDYYGPCQDVGVVYEKSGSRCSSSIKCPKVNSYNCQLLVPPGACCPICGGALRIVYSRKQIDRALYALRGKNTEILTLKSILSALENLIQISQCRLSGFLTFETDIFVIVQPIHKAPNFIQIEACYREAEKIVSLISIQSHRITSDLSLSALTVANMVKSTISKGSLALPILSLVILSLATILCLNERAVW